MAMITVDKIQYLQHRVARFDDHYAYKELFSSFYAYLFHFAMTLVKVRESAEEIVSDVFIKVWEKRKGLEAIDNLKVYLYVSTRNTALNEIEKQKKQAVRHIEELSEELPAIYLNPEQMLITADMLSFIRKAVDQLPPRCRMIFKLVKEDGLKYREVAEILDISTKTVENQVAIAVQKIAQTISFDLHRSIPSASPL